MPSVEPNVLGLSGKTAIVTGAGRGIGQATVRLLRTLGVNIAAVDQKFEPGKHDNTRQGNNIVRLVGDVADPNSANAAVKRCVEEFGTVDILVNSAAVNLGGALLEFKDQEGTE